ncbi:response regulator [Paenibacillus macerans]|uniref:response regulator n=1 Tax=Paenibacillus macerans TaxID=44252 RepID=UPI003D32387E
MLRAMIVDDEELSIKRLTRILSDSGDVDIRQTFLDPDVAYDYAKSHPVDIAFLDISMPEINGMKLSGLLQELDESMDIVFVTGYDTYAVEAFDRNALDYLLKPVTSERVSRTLGKARKKRGEFAAAPGLEVKLFNGLKILRPEAGGGTIKLRSPKTEELFAFLLCKKSVSREEIADTLWNGLGPEKALKNLNSTLYYIRKAIGEGKTGSCIAAGKNEIRMQESAIVCDLYDFEGLMMQMKRTPEQSAVLFNRAEALYTGQLLKGKAYEWAGEYSRRIELDYIRLLELAARHHQVQQLLQELGVAPGRPIRDLLHAFT